MPNPELEVVQYARRVDDQYNSVAILLDIKSEVQAIRTELVEFKKDVNKAFPKDEDGLPDYAGHRTKHEIENKKELLRREYTTDFVKKFLGWQGIAFMQFIFYAILDYIRKG